MIKINFKIKNYHLIKKKKTDQYDTGVFNIYLVVQEYTNKKYKYNTRN